MRVMKMSKHVKDKISYYIDGLLQGNELREFELHVKTCDECGKALVEIKQAIKQAKKLKEEPLPVNFFVKLNQKLDMVDEEGKRDAFAWGAFARGTVVVFTLLIVGVFVYNLKKQTNNFSSMISKDEAQMPQKEEQASVQAAKPVVEEKVYKKAVSGGGMMKMDMDKGLEAHGNAMLEKKPAPKAPAAAGYLPMARAKKKTMVSEQAKMKTYYTSAVARSEAAAPPAGNKAAGDMEAAANMPAETSANLSEEAPAPEAAAPAQAFGVSAKSPARSAVAQPAQTFVFKDAGSWKAFADSNGLKIAEQPDFASQMIVVVFSAAKPTAGYSVAITGVQNTAGSIIVSYKETAPPAGSVNAQIVTYPYTYKIINKSDLQVEFEAVQ
jgi:hypothetical protein